MMILLSAPNVAHHIIVNVGKSMVSVFLPTDMVLILNFNILIKALAHWNQPIQPRSQTTLNFLVLPVVQKIQTQIFFVKAVGSSAVEYHHTAPTHFFKK